MGVVASVEFKRCVADARILDVVVGKLSYWKESSPIVLLIIDKNFEVSFYCTVLPLGLAISLRVEGSRELSLDFREVA